MRIQAFSASNSPKNIGYNPQKGLKKAQSFTANFEYKSMSKIRHLFAKIIGEKRVCATDDGFVRVAKFNRHGQKVSEIKSYPNSPRYAITRFETKQDVTKPLERIVYDLLEDGEKPELVNYKRYKDGYPFYSFDYKNDYTYTRVQELGNGNSLVEKGMIDVKGNEVDVEKVEVPSKNPRKEKPQLKKYIDGAIIQVKAKDLPAFTKGVAIQVAQNINKSAKKLKNPFLKDTNNIGAIFVENPYYDSFRVHVSEQPRTRWAAQNLEQWGFHYPYPKGENPDDVFDVYIPRTEKAVKAFEMPKFVKFLCDGVASQNVKDFYSAIVTSRFDLDFLFTRPLHPKKDYDFIKEADYLFNASVDAQYTDFVRTMAQDLKLKPLEYRPKVKAQ